MFWRLITGNEEAEEVQGRDKWGGRFSFVFPPQVKCYTSLSLKKTFWGFSFGTKLRLLTLGPIWFTLAGALFKCYTSLSLKNTFGCFFLSEQS